MRVFPVLSDPAETHAPPRPLLVALVALALALPARAAEASDEPPSIDEGAIVDAVELVLARGKDAVRIAVPPVQDANEARRKAIEIAVVRAILDRRREEVVTPAYLRAKLRAQSEAQTREVSAEELRPFACDHVLLASVVDEGGKSILHLKLVHAETGQVLGDEPADLGAGSGARTTASAGNVRNATDRLVEQIAFAVESNGDDVRTQRIAVSPLHADGAAKESRLDQFVQSELIRALARRGFLVVERAQLAAAIDQLALGQVLDEQGAPQAGKVLGAQHIVIGRVTDGGTQFLVSARVVSSESGQIVGAASASFPRDDVVAMAAVETRTPLEAAVRSAVAPGWGQAYNGQGEKALVFGIAGYGGAAVTGALAVSGLVAQSRYNDVAAFEKLAPDQRAQAVVAARNTADALYLSTAIAGAVTVAVWSLGVADAFLSAAAATAAANN